MPPLRTSRSTAAPSAGLARDAGVAVRAAALQAERQMADAGTGSRFTLLASGSNSLMRAMPSCTVLRVPPVSWMVMVCSCVGALQTLRGQQIVDLVRLAAQPDHQRGVHIRVRGIAREHPAQQLDRLAGRSPCRSRSCGGSARRRRRSDSRPAHRP